MIIYFCEHLQCPEEIIFLLVFFLANKIRWRGSSNNIYSSHFPTASRHVNVYEILLFFFMLCFYYSDSSLVYLKLNSYWNYNEQMISHIHYYNSNNHQIYRHYLLLLYAMYVFSLVSIHIIKIVILGAKHLVSRFFRLSWKNSTSHSFLFTSDTKISNETFSFNEY